MTDLAFALNHMAAPGLGLADLFALARRLGARSVEIRNDLPGRPIADGTPPAAVRDLAERAGVEILSVNALYPFNMWDEGLAARAGALADYAAACGARGVVMCPLNDPARRLGDDERLSGLRAALRGLRPILERAGVTGLVEPLGFAESALRSKREAVEAVRDVGGEGAFRLVHDTFHHHVAGEAELFPEMTGLVHVSGVADPAVARDAMRDPHRALVDADDRLDNLGQLRALRAGGYRGPASFEPFAPAVHALPDPEAALAASMAFLAGGVARSAA